eukprot:s877_g8.t1
MQNNDLGALLQPWASRVLEICFQNDSEESTRGFLAYLMKLGQRRNQIGLEQVVQDPHLGSSLPRTKQLPDGTYINQFTQVPQEVFMRQLLLALANWVSTAGLSLDSHVPFQAMAGQNNNHKLEQFLQKVEESSGGQRNLSSRELSEFIYHMVLQLLNTSEFACVASALAGTLSDAYVSDVSIAGLASYPALMLAQLVNILEEMRAKVLRIALELAPYVSWQRFAVRGLVVQFCRYFTLTHSHADYRLQEHEAIDEEFQHSQFGIVLIDSYGSLLKMLQHIDHLYCNCEELIVAVDFEGVELNRHGPLCLVQMILGPEKCCWTIHDNPALVYVLDIHVLKRACNPFELATPGGISMKFILEDWVIGQPGIGIGVEIAGAA